MDVQGEKKELILDLAIDKPPSQCVIGEKLNEPLGKISGRLNHDSLELNVVINYEFHSE